jgi:hypothetical protein
VGVKEWIELLGTAIAGVAFAVGLWQYGRAQAWARSEFAWKMVDRLFQDSDLALCRQLMDWSPRRITIPVQYQALMKPEEHRAVFVHSWEKLWQALTKTSQFTLEEMMYRDLFDTFFAYLCEIERSISTGLVKPNDLSGVTYWIEKVAIIKVNADGPLVFYDFVRKYYWMVEQLMVRYGIYWPKSTRGVVQSADATAAAVPSVVGAIDHGIV